jgi:hypothetical protein
VLIFILHGVNGLDRRFIFQEFLVDTTNFKLPPVVDFPCWVKLNVFLEVELAGACQSLKLLEWNELGKWVNDQYRETNANDNDGLDQIKLGNSQHGAQSRE